MSAEHFDAFYSPNYHPLAEVGLHLKYFNNPISYPAKDKKLIVHKAFDTNVAILKLFPGIILNVTQCHGGSVEMGLYETSRQMLAAGVVSGKDITSEASVTKLMHLLGRYSSREKVVESLNKSLAGEIT